VAAIDTQIRSSGPAAGFTLVEMAIVLVIVGVALAMFLGAGGSMLDNQERQAARTRLDGIDAALASFVAVHQRLPCPADGRIASGALNAGIETLSATAPVGACNPASQAFGVLPWVTLGLAEGDANDPWGGRITYRVDPQLAAGAPLTLLMDMSSCDPSATGVANPANGACKAAVVPCVGSAACTAPASFLANKGLDVWDGLNAAPGWASRQNNRANGSGAAYVIISHGPSGNGAYNNRGVLQPGSVVLGLDEAPNVNGQVLALPATQLNTYRDAPLNDNEALFVPVPPVVPAPPPRTRVHFDDYLSHPTIMSVLNKANLGPRAH
jgi:prepilin-type N-terminal cleavage/methylation domain-containing protein